MWYIIGEISRAIYLEDRVKEVRLEGKMVKSLHYHTKMFRIHLEWKHRRFVRWVRLA